MKKKKKNEGYDKKRWNNQHFDKKHSLSTPLDQDLEYLAWHNKRKKEEQYDIAE